MYAQATQVTDDSAASQEVLSQQQQSEPPKSSGFLSGLVGDRKERTLAGAVVGRVRDAFSGDLTEEEKVKRAEGNDFVGTIAADTVAMMARRPVLGGLARASMMADTKGDARDFALGFAKDGLEGVGLNYIGKIAQPGSKAYNFVGSKFGGFGIKQEIALHAGTGALFGALKAGSDPHAWRDQNGHFSFQSGLNNLTDWKKMGTATISGAVINVPAGMIGMRLAKSSTLSVANRTGSETFGRVTGGVISGAGSGGVFGGLDGVIQGKSLSEIGQSTFDGMLIGGATGGVMTGWHAFRPGKQAPVTGDPAETQPKERIQEPTAAKVQESMTAQVQEAVLAAGDKKLGVISQPSREKITHMLEEALTPEQLNRAFEVYDKIAYNPSIKLGVKELNKLLIQQPNMELPVRRVKNDPNMPETFANEAEFLKWTEVHNEPARVYHIQGTPTKVIIPEAYAKKLDAIRELRVWAETDAPSFDNLESTQRRVLQKHAMEGKMDLMQAVFGEKADNIARIIKARLEVTTGENSRALPEDFIQAIKSLPDPRLVKELIIMDEPDYSDRYVRTGEEAGMPTAANASERGTIMFFEAYNGQPKGTTSLSSLHKFFAHEWAHLLKFKMKEHSALFNEAAELETGYYSREYAKRQYPDHPNLKHHENWAVHLGEELLMPDADGFFITANAAPIRTTLMAKAWLESLVPGNREVMTHPGDFVSRIKEIPQRVVKSDIHAARLKYIAEEVVPVARQHLLEHLQHGSPLDQQRAAMILGRVGDPADITVMTEVFNNTTDMRLRKNLFQSMVNISSLTPDARLNFLVEHARVEQPLREEAMAALAHYKHPEAFSYHEVLRLSASERNIPQLMTFMEKTAVTGAKRMAFDNIVKLAKTGPYANEFMEKFLLRALRHHPDLRLQALNEAVQYPSMNLELEVMRLQRAADTEIAERAKQASAEMKMARTLNQLKNWTAGSDESLKYRAIQDLAWANDNRAIPVLLEVVGSGQPKWANEALGALQHYSPNMIQAYAHQLQRDGRSLSWGEVKQRMSMQNTKH